MRLVIGKGSCGIAAGADKVSDSAVSYIKEKGLMCGLLVGLMYIVCLTLIVFLAKDSFAFEMDIMYKVLLVSISGGIGGVLGVNFK